jgi:hypothetical protein
MSLQTLESELGVRLGLPSLRLNDEQSAGIQHVATGVELDLQLDGHRRLLHVCALVAPLPATGHTALLRELLVRNSEPRSEVDPVLAVDRDSRQIALSVSLPIEDLDAATVLAAIDAVAAGCGTTREWLSARAP